MMSEHVSILDQSGSAVAAACVTAEGDCFGGTVDLSSMPAGLRRTFEEYEEIVNGQVFSLLDEIEERISSLQLRVAFPTGRECPLEDLQIYPGAGRITFKLRREQPEAAGPVR